MKIKYIIGIFLFIFALSACENNLDIKNNFNVGDEDVWRIPKLAEGVLIKAYAGIPVRPDTYGDNFLDCATNDAVTNVRNSAVYKAALGGITEFNNPLGNWDKCYKMLQYVNSFLENGLKDNILYNRADSTVNSIIKKRLRGEALFLRAYWQFELLKMYGGKANNGEALGVVLADHFMSQKEVSNFSLFKRSSYQASIDFIIKDLDDAMTLLPESYTGTDINMGTSQIGRASIPACLVLKSQALLFSASPAMQNDDITKITGMGEFTIVNESAYNAKWVNVALKTAEILKHPGFEEYHPELAKNLADANTNIPDDFVFFRYIKNNYLERLYFPPYYYGRTNSMPSENFVRAFSDIKGYPYGDPRANWNYENLDKRFKLNVYYNGCLFGDSGVALNMSEGGKDSPSFHIDATRSGYYIAKFLSKKAGILSPITPSSSIHYNPILRKSEVFMNFAEASNEAWGPKVKGPGCEYSAYDIIKFIRLVSGGISDVTYLDEQAQNKDTFRKLIQNERRLEFSFEEHRYFDMRRWILPLDNDVYGISIEKNYDGSFIYSKTFLEKRNYEIKHYFSPLPYLEITKNENLQNNQGW